MPDVELKPCPFCGHIPYLQHDDIAVTRCRDDGDLIVRWKVRCNYCGVEKSGGATKYIFRNDETLLVMSPSFDGRKGAIERWNRRAGDDEGN